MLHPVASNPRGGGGGHTHDPDWEHFAPMNPIGGDTHPTPYKNYAENMRFRPIYDYVKKKNSPNSRLVPNAPVASPMVTPPSPMTGGTFTCSIINFYQMVCSNRDVWGDLLIFLQSIENNR